MNRLHQFSVLTAWYREYMRVNGYRPRTVADYCFELSFFRRFLESETDIEDIDAITHALLHAYAAWLYDRGLSILPLLSDSLRTRQGIVLH